MRTLRLICSAAVLGAPMLQAGPFGMIPLREKSHSETLNAGAAALVQLPHKPGKEFVSAHALTPGGWFQVDLKPVANWAYAFGPQASRAWLNMGPDYDLSCLQPGPCHLYQIPFHVIDGAANNGKSCLTIRSQKLTDRDLPTAIEIPVNRKASRLYFLHGCGYATWGQNREYRMVYRDGTSAVQLIRPAGTMSGQGENIGDWFADKPVESVLAKPVPLLRKRDSRLVFIYALDWKNPHPEKMIEKILFQSDGEGIATIFLLAVSGNYSPE